MKLTIKAFGRLAALVGLAGLSLFVLSQDNPTPGVHPTTPGLTGAEALVEISHPAAQARAREALIAAGLTPHRPMESTIGGSNAWVWAIINSVDAGEGKCRVVVSAASNPEKRGESHRVCMFLMDYMKTGKAPTNAPYKNYAGVYEWAWANHIGGAGKSKVTLHPDGKVTCEGENWGATIWWSEDGKVFVYFPSPFPKENLQYVCQFAVSPDGRTMTMPANYYYRSVTATRIGDVPGASAVPVAPSNPAVVPTPALGGAVLDVAPADSAMHLDAPTYKPGPLPLPPVGAMMGTKTLAPASEDEQFPMEIVSVKGTNVPDRDLPNEFSGDLMVEVLLNDVGVNYVAHVYVGGYIVSPRDSSGGGAKRQGVIGITYDGQVPAYEYKRLHSSDDQLSPQPGKLRRYLFQMPDVLPAKIRVELYQQLRDGDKLVGTKEATFDMPFEDYKLVQGVVAGKASKKITKIMALAGAGVREMLFVLPYRAGATSESSTFRRRGRPHPETSVITLIGDYDITEETPWKEATINVWPDSRDRDRRNNRYYPGLPNGGYQDREPIYRWAPGGSALLAILER
ncbi:MAG TPA: hypothetical protein PLX06_01875 [Fimbriimonadaceae bacterium]|nr:hypothetical protein [Fimbriimonadaceae bacterium]